jgi:hypothetical protein
VIHRFKTPEEYGSCKHVPVAKQWKRQAIFLLSKVTDSAEEEPFK